MDNNGLQYLQGYAQMGMFNEIKGQVETQLIDEMVADFKERITPIVKAKTCEILGKLQTHIQRDIMRDRVEVLVAFGDPPADLANAFESVNKE